MIVFKNNSILMVAIFISSLIKIKEAILNEVIPHNQIMLQNQEYCRAEISRVFAGEDIREHGIIAINNIHKIFPNGCSIISNLGTFNDYGELYHYYSEFRTYLISSSIPQFQDVCSTFNGLNERLCMLMLAQVYGNRPHQALIRAFYFLRSDILLGYGTKDVGTLSRLLLMDAHEEEVALVEEHQEEVKMFPSVVMHYWDEILRHFSINIMQETCCDQITKVFPGENLLEHSVIAVNSISRDFRQESCHIVLSPEREFHDDGDLYAYYESFNKHLRSDAIPTFEEFCKIFKEIDQAICKHMLSKLYGNDKHAALIIAFYQMRRDTLDTFLSSDHNVLSDFITAEFDTENLARTEVYGYDIIQFKAVALYYWGEILRNIRVYSGPHGMLPKTAFCAEKYKIIDK